jgi:hypothetical protein
MKGAVELVRAQTDVVKVTLCSADNRPGRAARVLAVPARRGVKSVSAGRSVITRLIARRQADEAAAAIREAFGK